MYLQAITEGKQKYLCCCVLEVFVIHFTRFFFQNHPEKNTVICFQRWKKNLEKNHPEKKMFYLFSGTKKKFMKKNYVYIEVEDKTLSQHLYWLASQGFLKLS